MKISMTIIEKYLEMPIESANYNQMSNLMILGRPQFYVENESLDLNSLYICYGNELPDEIDENIKYIISIGKPPEKYFTKSVCLLVLGKECSLLKLSNKIHKIFDFFQGWDDELKEAITKENPLSLLISSSEKIFNNGLSIMDSEYFIIHQSNLSLNADKYDELDEAGALPAEVVNDFKSNEDYRNISQEKEIFIYQGGPLAYKCLCKNIYYRDEFIYRVIVAETNTEIREIDKLLLEHLSGYAQKVAEDIQSIYQEDNKNLALVLKNIIKGDLVSQNLLEESLNRLGWLKNNDYRLLYIEPSNYDKYISTTNFFIKKIMREFKGSVSFLYEKEIIVVFNMDKLPKEKDEYFSDLYNFIREANFRAGLSNYFMGFEYFKESFNQAKIALELGSIRKPTYWTHKFSDYVFSYILEKVSEDFPVEFLYSPIIDKLQRHDIENNTSYVETLKVYLENNLNALKTSKDLFIHRATMIYRLERIKEIGETDLKNSDQILHLFLSFRLLQEKKEI